MKKLMTAAVISAALWGMADAAPLNTNLVVNGDAETGDMAGWTTGGIEAGVTNPFSGTYAFTGAAGARTETMEQVVDLSGLAGLIDSGDVEFTLSAQLQNRTFAGVFDRVVMSLAFLDAADDSLGAPVTASDRSAPNGVYDWDFREILGQVPANARSALLLFTFSRSGFSSTDAYADEISFVLSSDAAAPIPVPGALPLFLGGIAAFAARRHKRRADTA